MEDEEADAVVAVETAGKRRGSETSLHLVNQVALALWVLEHTLVGGEVMVDAVVVGAAVGVVVLVSTTASKRNRHECCFVTLPDLEDVFFDDSWYLTR